MSLKFEKSHLLSKFDFPIACLDFSINPSANKLAAVGIYKPSVKIYDFESMNQKIERHSVKELIKVEFLDDIKLACLRVDNSIEMHTKNGLYDVLKIPSSGTDILNFRGNLYVASNKLYRFDLDLGKLFDDNFKGSNYSSFAVSDLNGLLGFTDEMGFGFIDSRINEFIFYKNFEDVNCISIENTNSTKYMVGGESGTFEFDFRTEKFIEKFDIKADKLKYHNKNRIIISDQKIHIEDSILDVGYKINAFECDSGVFFVGGENDEMETYFCSSIGEAPEWCKSLGI